MVTFFFLGIFIGIIIYIAKPKRCSVCNAPFKRKYYKWTIDNKTQYLCPYCSNRLDRQQSSKKFNERFK